MERALERPAYSTKARRVRVVHEACRASARERSRNSKELLLDFRRSHLIVAASLAGACLLSGPALAAPPSGSTCDASRPDACREECDRGSLESCVALADLYQAGKGVPKDASQSFRLFRKACDEGSMAGCRGLGRAYRDGLGAPKDPTRAAQLFNRACDGAVLAACFDLARAYEVGSGVPLDLVYA
ncbi:MAG: hypothetical protein JWN48_5040, partial [Myxococcaceae bacterium]|nr:hypothetical protein [Myxococcaceae bacterium]